ncbi:MAG: transcription-coupled DNA repair protein, partial [Monoraphidium minutum]
MASVVTSKAQLSALDELMPTDDDLLYEEELLRNPYSLKMWWRYITARTDASARRRYVLYERALKALPGSYKLWAAYLSERRLAVRGSRPDAPARSALRNTYERALVSMHKMPRVWLDYLELLLECGGVTGTRRAFDRALAALPITQHDRVWVLYLRFLGEPGMPVQTSLRVYRRYLQLEPGHVEEFIAYCRAHELWGEVASRLAGVLNDDTFRSLEGKSKHMLWLELCDTVTRHPKAVEGSGVDVEAVLRGGIRRFTDEVGRLWTSLADYFIRRAMFEKARDVYEEGLCSVVTVRDFGLVFDALTHFEESLLAAKMAQMGDEEPPEQDPEDGGDDFLLKDDGDDIDLRLARLEALTARRPELLSAVMLRQNPHNVAEWHKRVKLFEGSPTKQILTYTEAVKTVDVAKALGKPHSLWCAFAKFYERHGDVPNARIIFQKAVQVAYRYVDDLASVWCEWAEMELRHNNFKRALDLMRTATAKPARPRQLSQEEERQLPVQERLYRSIKLWSFFADLEESLGTLESAAAVYDGMLALRIATPQVVLNYALMLQEAKHWEDAFKVYEKGVALFKYPHVGDVWQAYLKQFVARYGGTKLERARDLFESALQGAPPDKARPLYLEYARLEEEHGLARRAMEVYARALVHVPKDERLGVLDVYIARASDFFGVAKVREIYEAAIETEPPNEFPNAAIRQLCIRYSNLERKLGEVDRARAVLIHGAALADPRRPGDEGQGYWAAWHDFEVRHGNEDTFKEMLRVKRSVAASYAQMHIDSSAQLAHIAAAAA